ncbi:MAG: 3'-5' exonuclease, partial [Halocynthiibacter sp.]
RRKGEFLWQALRAEDSHSVTRDVLSDLLREADFLRPWDLIERILTKFDGRRKLIARLGQEVEDGLDALLYQAEAYEQTAVPSLTGFLNWLDSGDITIKRQPDGAGNRIRVMTVHGAKGLEAPIVILPDTASRKNDVREEILNIDGAPIWKPGSDVIPDLARDARDAIAQRQLEEKDRLLYVAMTRAEKWLIVAGAGDVDGSNTSWYRQVESGIQHAGAVECDFENGLGLRLESGVWGRADPKEDVPETPIVTNTFPQWIDAKPSPCPASLRTVSPSDLGGAKVLAEVLDGEGDKDQAMLYGTLVHHLLEHLPPLAGSERAAHAQGLLLEWTDVDETVKNMAMAEALDLLQIPALFDVFSPETQAEVALSADLPDGQRLHGIVDRLLLRDGRVTAVDFKTNRLIPVTVQNVPEGLLRQMGAYAHALSQIFPKHEIDTAILWTKSGELMPLPHDLVSGAFDRAAFP